MDIELKHTYGSQIVESLPVLPKYNLPLPELIIFPCIFGFGCSISIDTHSSIKLQVNTRLMRTEPNYKLFIMSLCSATSLNISEAPWKRLSASSGVSAIAVNPIFPNSKNGNR